MAYETKIEKMSSGNRHVYVVAKEGKTPISVVFSDWRIVRKYASFIKKHFTDQDMDKLTDSWDKNFLRGNWDKHRKIIRDMSIKKGWEKEMQFPGE